jgi:hypothetical protein
VKLRLPTGREVLEFLLGTLIYGFVMVVIAGAGLAIAGALGGEGWDANLDAIDVVLVIYAGGMLGSTAHLIGRREARRREDEHRRLAEAGPAPWDP